MLIIPQRAGEGNGVYSLGEPTHIVSPYRV